MSFMSSFWLVLLEIPNPLDCTVPHILGIFVDFPFLKHKNLESPFLSHHAQSLCFFAFILVFHCCLLSVDPMQINFPISLTNCLSKNLPHAPLAISNSTWLNDGPLISPCPHYPCKPMSLPLTSFVGITTTHPGGLSFFIQNPIYQVL